MKGQYLALEAVFTVALGLSVGITVVTLTNTYSSNVESELAPDQADIIRSKIAYSIDKLKSSDVGRRPVELPDRIGGSEYRVSASDNQLIVSSQGEQFNYDLKPFSYDVEISGSAPGGKVTLFKQENKIRLSG